MHFLSGKKATFFIFYFIFMGKKHYIKIKKALQKSTSKYIKQSPTNLQSQQWNNGWKLETLSP